jgi:polyisoprenyl-teichoic acid--peptidoglycan teichoic acid transferase
MTNLPKQARIYISLGVILLIILVSFSIIFFGVYQVYFAPVTLFSRVFTDSGQLEEQFEDRVVNVAILGLHNRNEDNTFGEIYFVDTIMIASINFDQNSLTLLAVPRDSYVEIACSGSMDRLRQSYSYGYMMSEEGLEHETGLQCSIETIGSLLEGVKLHYYIAMDIQGLKQLIDSMGGVYFSVEKPMIGFTPQESLDAGPQLLDGQGYMTYLTYREPDARDDLNRIKRQKELLRATFRYFQEMGLFSYVVPTYAAYREHIITDLSFNQVAALALFAGERLESDAIHDYSLKGEYFTIDNGDTYYLLLDEKKNKELLEQFNRDSGGR